MATSPFKQADLVRIAKAAKKTGVVMDLIFDGRTIRIYPNADPLRLDDSELERSNEWDFEV
jgi:hypothetical protein